MKKKGCGRNGGSRLWKAAAVAAGVAACVRGKDHVPHSSDQVNVAAAAATALVAGQKRLSR